MNKYHNIKDIHFKENQLFIKIDNEEYSFHLKSISKILQNANDFERNTYEISASGYGIHWYLVDEDLSIDGLLGVKHLPKFYDNKVLA
jgi:hypothetical protein